MTNREKLKNATKELKSALCNYLDVFADVVIVPEELEMIDGVAEATEALKPTPKSDSKKSSKKAPAKKAEVEEDTDEVNGTFDREQLDGMKYNDLKKLAKDLGIPAKGDRVAITEAILAADVSAPIDEDTDDEEDEEPTPKKKTASKSKKKTAKKEEPEEVEEDEEEDDTDEDDSDLDEIKSQVEEITADMSVEDIAEILADAGIKAKGKKQSLVDKLIQAVADGVIELDDSEDEDEEYDEDDNIPDDEADDEDDGEDVNDLSNADLTDERKEALIALDKKLRKQYKDKKLKVATMKKALVNYYGEDAEEEVDELSKEDLLDSYIYIKQLYIDDDGEQNAEEEPYTVNGVDYCCGKPLEYDEDEETYTCSVCGSEYGD